MRSWENYFIPGTSVLENKLGLTTNEALERAESRLVLVRLLQFFNAPIEGGFDYAHMKAIHFHLFQDVYDWAGEERSAPTGAFMTKDGFAYYPAGPELGRAANKQYDLIREANYLRGLPREEFVVELAERWGELNVVHSFREGNTRSQCLFCWLLTCEAGFKFDVSALFKHATAIEAFNAARRHSQSTGSNSPLAETLDALITEH